MELYQMYLYYLLLSYLAVISLYFYGKKSAAVLDKELNEAKEALRKVKESDSPDWDVIDVISKFMYHDVNEYKLRDIWRNEKYKLVEFLENELEYLKVLKMKKFYGEPWAAFDGMTVFAFIFAGIAFATGYTGLALLILLSFSPIIVVTIWGHIKKSEYERKYLEMYEEKKRFIESLSRS